VEIKQSSVGTRECQIKERCTEMDPASYRGNC